MALYINHEARLTNASHTSRSPLCQVGALTRREPLPHTDLVLHRALAPWPAARLFSPLCLKCLTAMPLHGTHPRSGRHTPHVASADPCFALRGPLAQTCSPRAAGTNTVHGEVCGRSAVLGHPQDASARTRSSSPLSRLSQHYPMHQHSDP
jgi:hypothetical protein